MPKVTTPQGEEVKVFRRWFPWPHFATVEQLEGMGISDDAAAFLARSHVADWAIVAVASFIPLMLLLSGQLSLFLVIAALTAIILFTVYMALPWRIEVVHDGQVVESEKSDGFSLTGERVKKVAELYRSGALKLPEVVEEAPERISTLPVVGRLDAHTRDDAPLPNLDTRPTVEELVAKPELQTLPETVFTDPSTVREPEVPKAFSAESPLRRAIRAMEEEEARLAAVGGLKPGADPKVVAKARLKKGFLER